MQSLSPGAQELMVIGNRHGTDKFVDHKFHGHYARHLGHLRSQVFVLLEIGIYRGASLRTWSEYFPKARVVGLDVDPKVKEFPCGRAEVHIGDQADPAFLDGFAKRIGGFDVVIDDGSHVMEHQRTSLTALFPHVRPGGYYVMEDIQTSYWQNWKGGHIGMAGTGIAMVKDVVDDVNAEFHRGKTVLPATSVALHVYRNIAFIERG
jgi:hypothetical protein